MWRDRQTGESHHVPFSSHWVMRWGESKCFFLPFLYFSSFAVFISLSIRVCGKVLYHKARELHLVPHFLPSPNAYLPLERATKLSPPFFGLFCEKQFCIHTDFETLATAADVGDFLSTCPCFAPGTNLSMNCKNTAHSFSRFPRSSLLHMWLVGSEKAASQAFPLNHQDLLSPSSK